METKAKKGICFVTLNVSEKCTLNCSYCFVRKANPNNEPRNMSSETARAAVDFLARESGDHECCQLRFFGGEPLLNFPLVREVVPYAREVFARIGKTIVFSLATNGTIMNDEIGRFLAAENVKLSVSIDGDAAGHDANRRLFNDEGSLRMIEPHLPDILAIDPNALIVTTMTSANTGIDRTFEYYFERGFRNFRTELVATIDRGLRVGEEEIVRLTASYDTLADFYIALLAAGEKVNINDFTRFIWRMISDERVHYYCGAGKYYLNIMSDGGFMVCHRFIGNSDFLVGNVRDGITARERMEAVVPSVEDKPRCMACEHRELCGGGCAYDNYIMFRDVHVAEEMRCRVIECQVKNARRIMRELRDGRGTALQGAWDVYSNSYLSTERKDADISAAIAALVLPPASRPPAPPPPPVKG